MSSFACSSRISVFILVSFLLSALALPLGRTAHSAITGEVVKTDLAASAGPQVSVKDPAAGPSAALQGKAASPAGPAAKDQPKADYSKAEPVALEGVPNLHRLSQDLYRSAQPTAEGFKKLAAMGIKTVVNLRSFHSDDDKLAGTGITCVNIPMMAWKPEQEQVLAFLKVVSDPSKGPFLVHCQHGSDRTGTMCAIYRILVMGWTREKAIGEMINGGFGFHGIWGNLIKFLKELDLKALAASAGLKEPRNPFGWEKK